MSGPQRLPDDASVVMIWRRDAENAMNFVAKRDEAEAFYKKVFEKEPEERTAAQSAMEDFKISTGWRDEVVQLQTYPTPDGRRTTVSIRRGDVIMTAVDRHTGIMPLSNLN